jgi:hypothetical protein
MKRMKWEKRVFFGFEIDWKRINFLLTWPVEVVSVFDVSQKCTNEHPFVPSFSLQHHKLASINSKVKHVGT